MKINIGDKLEVYQQYKSILELIEKSKNKQRKRAVNEKRQLMMQHKFLENDYENEYLVYMQILHDLQKEEANKSFAEDFIASNVKSILYILNTNGFMEKNQITQKGKVACSVMEIHGLVFSELYMYHNGFEDLSYNEIGQLLSCFYAIKVNDEKKKSINIPDFTGYKLRSYLEFMKGKFDHYYDLEVKYGIDVGYDYETQYDLMQYVDRWCFASDENHATSILSDLKYEKEVFLGDFVKCCMKIVSILQAKVICEISENFICLEKLNHLESCLMKFIVSNESLYL